MRVNATPHRDSLYGHIQINPLIAGENLADWLIVNFHKDGFDPTQAPKSSTPVDPTCMFCLPGTFKPLNHPDPSDLTFIQLKIVGGSVWWLLNKRRRMTSVDDTGA